MTNLSSIRFYQLSKKRPMGEKKKTWTRRTHRDVAFEGKVKIIKMIAAKIDKLVNY